MANRIPEPPECISWAIGNIICYEIRCGNNDKKKVLADLKKSIKRSAKSQIKEFVEEYKDSVMTIGDYEIDSDEKISSINDILDIEYRIIPTGISLIIYGGTDFQANDHCVGGLDIDWDLSEYDGITYYGFSNYCWSDVHCGEAGFEISGNSENASDYVESVFYDCVMDIWAIHDCMQENFESTVSYMMKLIDSISNNKKSIYRSGFSDLVDIVFEILTEENEAVYYDDVWFSDFISILAKEKAIKAKHFDRLMDIAENNSSAKDVLLKYKNDNSALFEISEKIQNLTFVVTGKLTKFANRDAFVEYVENNSGKVTGSVSKKTDYLVNNDKDSESAKNKKARELCIEIITEDEFIEMFGM